PIECGRRLLCGVRRPRQSTDAEWWSDTSVYIRYHVVAQGFPTFFHTINDLWTASVHSGNSLWQINNKSPLRRVFQDDFLRAQLHPEALVGEGTVAPHL